MLAPSQITYLSVDLGRWDRSPGGDVLVVPLWTDVRPLRGVAGLLDWRLNGRLSQMLREEKLRGELGEKMLFLNDRVPWKHILAVGLGATDEFNEHAFKTGLRSAFDSFRGLGIKSVALALPGRDMERITPERAMRMLVALMGSPEEQNPMASIEALTIIDVPAAIKAMTETVKSLEKALIADIEITWHDQEERPHEEARPVEAAPPVEEARPAEAAPPVEEARPAEAAPPAAASPPVVEELHVEGKPHIEEEPRIEEEPHIEVDLHVEEELRVLDVLHVLEPLPVEGAPPVAGKPPVDQERPAREEGPKPRPQKKRRRGPGGKPGRHR